MTPNSNISLQTAVSYNAAWQATSVFSPNGATASRTYDTWGSPSTSTIPDGATTTYSYTYSPLNQQTAVLTTETGTIWKRTTLDGFGRTPRVENGNGATTNTPVSVVDTQYAPCGCSPLGKMYRVSMPYAGGGSPSAWTTYAYDERGRTIGITAADGTVTQYIYIGNETWINAHSWKVQTFDALGNLVNVTEPDTPNGFNNSTTYTSYSTDASGHSVTVQTGSNSNFSLPSSIALGSTGAISTSATYSSSWNVASMTGPNSATGTTTYDSYGRPSQTLSPDGAISTYTDSPPTQTATVNGRWQSTTLDLTGLGGRSVCKRVIAVPSYRPWIRNMRRAVVRRS